MVGRKGPICHLSELQTRAWRPYLLSSLGEQSSLLLFSTGTIKTHQASVARIPTWAPASVGSQTTSSDFADSASWLAQKFSKGGRARSPRPQLGHVPSSPPRPLTRELRPCPSSLDPHCPSTDPQLPASQVGDPSFHRIHHWPVFHETRRTSFPCPHCPLMPVSSVTSGNRRYVHGVLRPNRIPTLSQRIFKHEPECVNLRGGAFSLH